jgi:hypothetical protein
MIEVADKWKHYYYCSNFLEPTSSTDAAAAGAEETYERLYKSLTISSSAKKNTKSYQEDVTIDSRTDPSDFSPSRTRSSSSTGILRPRFDSESSTTTSTTANKFERLYKSHTFSSTQKQISALPRSKSSSASFRTSRSCTELPATNHSSSNSSTTTTGATSTTLGPSSTKTMPVFKRLAQASTVTSKTKSELTLKYRDELSKKISENKMRRNGDLRIDYGVISESQASDMYYRGMMSMTKMELQRVNKAIENNYQAEKQQIDLDKLILYSKVLENKSRIAKGMYQSMEKNED